MEKSIAGGYNGKVLRVNLTSGSSTSEQIDSSFCRKYLGGTGFIAYYLLRELKPDIDPLGPENKLIFAMGPLTGLSFGGSARHAVGSKSPLTGGIAKSEVGEHWGFQFKRSGFDALIIEGKAKDPVYLWIHNNEVEIKDARQLWGHNTKETQEKIRSEIGEPKARVAMIGPGGENLVRYACIMHGLFDAAGRGGTGAVMGSKNLKAVAVRGDRMPSIVYPDGVKEIAKWLKENKDLFKVLSDLGTGAGIVRFDQLGNLPVRNFRDSGFSGASKISAQVIKETMRTGMEGCYACPVRCKKVIALDEPYHLDPSYGGPEYETIGALGSACGIDDLKAIAKGSELCNAYSLDTISTGMSIAFAMECYENGLLASGETDGIEIKFGNADAMLQLIELIAKREKIGDLLAEGSAKAAEKIGKGAEKYAMHVKKLELPMHEPRINKALSLGYMVNPHGADHLDNMIDIFFNNFSQAAHVMVPDAVPLGLEPGPSKEIDPKRVALFKIFQLKRILHDSLVICHLLPYSLSQTIEITAKVTGWDTSVMEQCRIAERILTMCRMFNVREGFSPVDDQLPLRFFEPTVDGPLAHHSLTFEEMEKAKRYYYHLMGWDEKGLPMPEKLEELGIDQINRMSSL
jgi:aldehyde:ferredoxin oxidoreductase